MRLTRGNLKEIVRSEMTSLREEKAKLKEIDEIFDRLHEITETERVDELGGALKTMAGRLTGGAVGKAMEFVKDKLLKLAPAQKVEFLVGTLLPGVGIGPEDLQALVARIKGEAGLAAKEAGAAAPEEPAAGAI